MLKYALKRVVRSYRLFLALTVGILVATTFFASTNVAADILARDALDATLDGVVYDYVINSREGNWTVDTFEAVGNALSELDDVLEYARITSFYHVVNDRTLFHVFGIDWNSSLADPMTVVAGDPTLGPDEAYVVAGSLNETLY
ncbi:MAG: hypothetical protein QXQ81_04170 [Candidatus Thorarchaeota archaeon]